MNDFSETSGADSGGIAEPMAAESAPDTFDTAPDDSPEPVARERGSNGQYAKRPEPPHSWPAHIRDKHWQRLDPELQSYFATSEAERHKSFTELGSRAKQYEPFEKLLSEHGGEFQRRGLQPDEGIRFLLHAQKMFDDNPIQAAIQACAGYGVDLVAALKGDDSAIQQQVSQTTEKAGKLEQALAARTDELAKLKNENAELKKQIEAARHVESARRSAKVNVRSGFAYPAPKTMDDTLNEIARKAYG